MVFIHPSYRFRPDPRRGGRASDVPRLFSTGMKPRGRRRDYRYQLQMRQDHAVKPRAVSCEVVAMAL